MQPIDVELIEKIRLYTLSAVKKGRYQHSLRVAEMALLLSARYGLAGDKAYLAGIAHDMCKDLDDETQLSLASHDGMEITPVEVKKPALLHGRAAAIKLKRDFGVDDPEIIEAVAKHTFGGEDLGPLAKIIYVADKIECGRPQSNEEYRQELLKKDLNHMCLAVLQENLDYLSQRGKEVAPVTLRFKQSLEKSIEGEKK